ncbi:MAG: MurR/RpiR family transcriptional regulator [Candidatus Omnitrophica bacterium]|nr:MurR/RpiR family transcriptional regulator [Candidatus Omnitrophota bacterium]
MKIDCLSKIKSTATKKHKGIVNIANYILSSPEGVVNFTISELASNAKTSIASVSRFCNRLGYKNYRDFLIGLAASLSKNSAPVSDYFYENDKPPEIIKKVFEMNKHVLTETEGILNPLDITTIAKKILNAKRVFLIGVGGSGYVSKFGTIRFSSLGINAVAIIDPYEGTMALESSIAKDVIIGISHTGRSSSVINLLRIARQKKMYVVGITNYVDSALTRLADINLFTAFRERRINAAVSSTAVSQLCLLDCLYFVIAHYQGTKFKNTIRKIEQNAEKYLRQ